MDCRYDYGKCIELFPVRGVSKFFLKRWRSENIFSAIKDIIPVLAD